MNKLGDVIVVVLLVCRNQEGVGTRHEKLLERKTPIPHTLVGRKETKHVSIQKILELI